MHGIKRLGDGAIVDLAPTFEAFSFFLDKCRLVVCVALEAFEKLFDRPLRRLSTQLLNYDFSSDRLHVEKTFPVS